MDLLFKYIYMIMRDIRYQNTYSSKLGYKYKMNGLSKSKSCYMYIYIFIYIERKTIDHASSLLH